MAPHPVNARCRQGQAQPSSFLSRQKGTGRGDFTEGPVSLYSPPGCTRCPSSALGRGPRLQCGRARGMAEGPEMALQGSEGRAVALPGRPHPCAALLSAVSSAMGMNTPVPSPAPPLGGRPAPPTLTRPGNCWSLLRAHAGIPAPGGSRPGGTLAPGSQSPWPPLHDGANARATATFKLSRDVAERRAGERCPVARCHVTSSHTGTTGAGGGTRKGAGAG